MEKREREREGEGVEFGRGRGEVNGVLERESSEGSEV